MSATFKRILTFFAVVLAVTFVIWAVVSVWRAIVSNRLRGEQQVLQQDRQQADKLLQRLDGLKSLRDALVLPQVEMSVKL